MTTRSGRAPAQAARLRRENLWLAPLEQQLARIEARRTRWPATSLYGYASLSFLHSAAEHINGLDVTVYIYHFGDFDPSGVNAGEKIEQTLKEMAPGAEISFERIAVTPDQVVAWALPTRPTKASDTRAKGFGDISVELDAIDPTRLRDLVEMKIQRHLPPDQFATLKAAEASKRILIAGLVDVMRRGV